MNRYPQCILGTCPVPWDEQYRFAEGIFRCQVRYLLERGTRHLYIFGTAGEGYAVSDGQFDTITRAFAEEMAAGGAEPMVGLISLSLPTIIERIERSCAMGVRCFQLSLPCWGECTMPEILRFFRETCGRFPACSFLHYNCPRSKRMISPHEYGVLAQEFPNLVATKNGAETPIQMMALFRKAPQLRHFLTEFNFATACLMGLEAGFLISIASIHWKTAKQFYQAGVERQAAQLTAYTAELEKIHSALIRIVGSQGHIDGVYDKLFSKIADRRFPLRLLPPYNYAKDESFMEFVNCIREQYPNWLES